MHVSVIFEAWIVLDPKAVDPVGLSYDSFDHLALVVREVVGDIEHHVANEVAHCRKGLSSNVFQRELVFGRCFVPSIRLWIWASII